MNRRTTIQRPRQSSRQATDPCRSATGAGATRKRAATRPRNSGTSSRTRFMLLGRNPPTPGPATTAPPRAQDKGMPPGRLASKNSISRMGGRRGCERAAEQDGAIRDTWPETHVTGPEPRRMGPSSLEADGEGGPGPGRADADDLWHSAVPPLRASRVPQRRSGRRRAALQEAPSPGAAGRNHRLGPDITPVRRVEPT